MGEPPHPPVGEPCIEGAAQAGIRQTDDDAGLGNHGDQIPTRIVYEPAHGEREQCEDGKEGKQLGDVHDEAPSQVPAESREVERGSGEAEGGAGCDVRAAAVARISCGCRAVWQSGDGGSGRLWLPSLLNGKGG